MNRIAKCSLVLGIVALNMCATDSAHASPVPGQRPKGVAEALGLTATEIAKSWTVQQIDCTSPANVVYPGEQPSFTLQFINKTDQPLVSNGKVQVISYRTITPGADGFATVMEKIADVSAVPIRLEMVANGFQDIVVKPKIPAVYGAYVLVAEIDGLGRDWASAFVRTPVATPGKVQFPAFALDLLITQPKTMPLFKRLGIKGMRTEFGYMRTEGPGFQKHLDEVDKAMKMLSDNDITVMLTLHTSSDQLVMPLGHVRSWLNEKDEGTMSYPGDFTWLPQYDKDYQKFVKEVAGRWGWPKGPLNAVELWNEPWEGISIAGWGADMLRYREIYTHMAQGVEEARKESGVKVLIGGTSSSMNTEDKLFPDGDDRFLKWLDFTSIHYQPMAAWPAVVPEWVNRKHPNGAVKVWDTESWVANSEDRVAGVIASMRAQGQTRTAGVFHDAAYSHLDIDQRTSEGKKQRIQVVHAWAPSAAIAATQKFIGERPFKELVFKNGLPWVFQFSGLSNSVDDSTLVVVGDLSGFYDRERSLFWTVQGTENRKKMEALKTQLASLPQDAPPSDRKKITDALKHQVLSKASMTLDSARGFTLYDFYGNALPAKNNKIQVPLNGLGYFLRADGKKGSFARLLQAVKTASVQGLEPVEIIAHDMTTRIGNQSTLGISITNVLPRPVAGLLSIKLGNLTVQGATQKLNLAPNETKKLSLPVSGTPSDDNVYPLTATFDAGQGLVARRDEEMHVNTVAQRTVQVDGKLDDWQDVLPQPLKSEGGGAGMTEKAWFPFLPWSEKAGGVAATYIAYDKDNFYFAAKIADNTHYAGTVRFETRDDDQYFYPAVAHRTEKNNKGETVRKEELKWPEEVRRFSYRKNPDLPSGDGTDNVQIAFNAIPLGQDGVLPNPPGTMPRFMTYKDTDYEYALNQVAEKHGGGTEIWRLMAPGVPRKHFYPRQPKAPIDGGPVKNGKLSITREGNTRIVEASLPWSELPDVKKLLDAGKPIKFTARINNNGGAPLELAGNRSVSRVNSYALHDYWASSWANEVEFGWEK